MILLALEEHLDPEVFEQCAVDLIGKTGLSVVPVVGGGRRWVRWIGY